MLKRQNADSAKYSTAISTPDCESVNITGITETGHMINTPDFIYLLVKKGGLL
jgi:hypothetical protein